MQINVSSISTKSFPLIVNRNDGIVKKEIHHEGDGATQYTPNRYFILLLLFGGGGVDFMTKMVRCTSQESIQSQ